MEREVRYFLPFSARTMMPVIEGYLVSDTPFGEDYVIELTRSVGWLVILGYPSNQHMVVIYREKGQIIFLNKKFFYSSELPF